MSEISMYEAQKKKMQGLCDEHDLVYRFEKDRYPIIFTIKPVQGMDAQISMLENVEEVGYRSPDASMSWIFEDGGLDTKVTGGTFTISKTLRTKIESILVKMITYWQQYFFRDVLEKNALRSGLMPVIDEDEADDTDEEPEDEGDMQGEDGPEVDLDDPDIQQAITIVRAENKATVGLLQRRMSVGYAKAARLIDAMYSEEGTNCTTWGTEDSDPINAKQDWTNGHGTYTIDPETGKKVETEWANTICENFYDGAFPVKFRYAMSHVSFPRWGAADYTMATREEKYVASSCLWAQASNALEYPAAINLTTDAQKAVAEIDNISNYINEMTYKFITGAEPLTNFDTYMDTLQKMGIENLIQLHQEAYDSFMSRGK